MKEIINFATIEKLLDYKDGYFDLIDNDQVLISISNYFEIYVTFHYKIVLEEDGLTAHVTAVYLENEDKFFHIISEKNILKNLIFGDDIIEAILDNEGKCRSCGIEVSDEVVCHSCHLLAQN